MSYASYSEDILKKHESDIFDLLRELEHGGISEVRQYGALPEFAGLVKQLGDLLLDPAQPAAMRLLDLRHTNSGLGFDLVRANEKVERLGATNRELNTEKLRIEKELRKAREEARDHRTRAGIDKAAMGKRLTALTIEREKLAQENKELKEKVERLEFMALRAQVDRRY
jgi:hypothetical protein